MSSKDKNQVSCAKCPHCEKERQNVGLGDHILYICTCRGGVETQSGGRKVVAGQEEKQHH